jgi:hypothetical protein
VLLLARWVLIPNVRGLDDDAATEARTSLSAAFGDRTSSIDRALLMTRSRRYDSEALCTFPPPVQRT